MSDERHINSIVEMIGGTTFLNICVDDAYDDELHKYTDAYQVLINVTEISSIEEYAPDDEDYDGIIGTCITVKNGDKFVTMEYTINKLLREINDAGYGNPCWDEY